MSERLSDEQWATIQRTIFNEWMQHFSDGPDCCDLCMAHAAAVRLSSIDALCARHGVTVEGIVALVDDVMLDTLPSGPWDIYYLRRLARREEA